jgi:hypothetical protein
MQKQTVKLSTPSNRQHARIAFSILALASAMIMPASAQAQSASPAKVLIIVPSKNGLPGTLVECYIQANPISFSGTNQTLSNASVSCQIAPGNYGYGTSVYVTVPDISLSAYKNGSRYASGKSLELRAGNSFITYGLAGRPPLCVKGQSYQYRTEFTGRLSVTVQYSGAQSSSGSQRVTSINTSYTAASSNCNP